ncbi:MAG: hypothetical protein JHC71_20190, partial [Blastococcus sp.]|nr:hypothetical protein [Blastococcus sp.]
LRLGTFRSVWAAPEVEASPALRFLAPRQQAELAPADAARLGIGHGERVLVGGVPAVAHLRTATPEGSIFLQEGIEAAPAGAASVEDALVEVTKA